MCTRPLHKKQIREDGTYYYESFPCGKCAECKRKYQNEWMIRMSSERKNWRYCYFITLTYNEDSVPLSVDTFTGELFRTVYKGDISTYLKRFRTQYKRKYGVNADFKYFITSEYGPRTSRPHYHALFFFNFNLVRFIPLLTSWKSDFGNYVLEQVKTIEGISSYVSKYCSKGVFESPLVSENKVNKTFHLISKGIGKSEQERLKKEWKNKVKQHFPTAKDKLGHYHGYNKEYLEFILDNSGKYHYNGFVFSMPKYWKEYMLMHKIEKTKEVFDNKTRTYKTVKYMDYDRNSSLQTALKALLQERNDEVYFKKLGEIRAAHPTWEDKQVFHEYFKEEHDLLVERDRQATKKQAEFLFKGKYDGLFRSGEQPPLTGEGRILREFDSEDVVTTIDYGKDFIITNIDLYGKED